MLGRNRGPWVSKLGTEFYGVQCRSRVAVCPSNNLIDSVISCCNLHSVESAIHYVANVLIVKGLKNQNTAPRKYRCRQAECRIFRCRANERNRTVFHKPEKSILLCSRKVMNFVQEQECSFGSVTGFLCDFSNLCDAARYCASCLEMRIGVRRNNSRQGGLASTGGTPQDYGAECPTFDCGSDVGTFTQ